MQILSWFQIGWNIREKSYHKSYLPKYFCQTVVEVGKLLLFYTSMGNTFLISNFFAFAKIIIKFWAFVNCQFCESKVLRPCKHLSEILKSNWQERLKICDKNFKVAQIYVYTYIFMWAPFFLNNTWIARLYCWWIIKG